MEFAFESDVVDQVLFNNLLAVHALETNNLLGLCMACDTDDSDHSTSDDATHGVVSNLSIDLLLRDFFMPSLLVFSIHGISSSKLRLEQSEGLLLNDEFIWTQLFLRLGNRCFTEEEMVVLVPHLVFEFGSLSCLTSVNHLATQVVDWSLGPDPRKLRFSWLPLALWLFSRIWSLRLLGSLLGCDDCLLRIVIYELSLCFQELLRRLPACTHLHVLLLELTFLLHLVFFVYSDC